MADATQFENTLVASGTAGLSWCASLGLVVAYSAIAANMSLVTFRVRDLTS